MHRSPEHIAPSALADDVQAYRSGADDAGDRLAAAIRPAVALDVDRFLGEGDPDAEDVVQESVVAALGYVRRRSVFRGDLVKLAVTIARNRCRDLHRYRRIRPATPVEALADWLADPSRSALDDLAERDVLEALQAGLDRLSGTCRWLLRALYLEGRTLDSVRHRLGLGSPQGVLYRRGLCLDALRNFLTERLRVRSGGEKSAAANRSRRRGEGPR